MKFWNDPNLQGQHKLFDQKLCDTYDAPARKVLKNVLGEFVEDNPNLYQQDMIINSSNCKYKYLEIQVCTTWEKQEYPHKTLFVYERKSKYGPDTLYITLNRFMTRGFLFDRDSFSGLKPRRLQKYSREFVYDVPWHRVMPVFIDCLDKETVESY